MPSPVSVIIPTLNEEKWLAATIDAAFAAGASEVIVADGGSSDGTLEIALMEGARIVTGERMRARQLNRGAEIATHDALIFVHADTLLPPGAAEAVARAIEDGFVFGGFRVRFAEGGARLAYVAFMINARTRLTKKPWGDQAQFTSRRAFGGFREIPIMEDYELSRRMKPSAFLPLTVTTSGRRFLRKGVILASAINWLIIFAYHLGVSPERLARWYR